VCRRRPVAAAAASVATNAAAPVAVDPSELVARAVICELNRIESRKFKSVRTRFPSFFFLPWKSYENQSEVSHEPVTKPEKVLNPKP
jgi:hypothetical protein